MGSLGGGGAAVVGLRRRWRRDGAGCVCAACGEFLKGVIQFLDKGIYVVEVVQIIPQERIQLRIVEQVFDVPVPQVVEEILEVIKVFHKSGCPSASWS